MVLIGVNFHKVDWRDWVSVLLYLFGKLLFLDMEFVHVSLTIKQGASIRTYDFVREGVWTYQGDTIRTLDDCRYFQVTEDEALEIVKRIHYVANQGLRISALDLWAVGFRCKPTGLVCTTFITRVLRLPFPKQCSAKGLLKHLDNL